MLLIKHTVNDQIHKWQHVVITPQSPPLAASCSPSLLRMTAQLDMFCFLLNILLLQLYRLLLLHSILLLNNILLLYS